METLPALPESQVDTLIAQAIDKSVPVETLEKLLAMRSQLKAEYAKEQFNIAMSAFQEECPVLIKNKTGSVTKSGIVVSRYTPLDSIVRQTKSLISKHGFRYSLDTQPDIKGVHTYLTIHHTLGHEETKHVFMPFVERTAVMTDAQVEMATMTIATRRVFCNAFGIVTGDEDTDGKGYKPQTPTITYITKEQIEEIENLIIESQLPLQGILQQYKVKELTELTTQQAQSIITKMERYIERKRREQIYTVTDKEKENSIL